MRELYMRSMTCFEKQRLKKEVTQTIDQNTLPLIIFYQMFIENLPIPKVVQENLTDIIKLYVRYGPDYNLIMKEFELIVQEKITTKIISELCFELNKLTYQKIVDYLKLHKEEKGQKDITYQNLWPQKIEDQKLRTQIQNLPSDIMKILNKDLSQAYNLLMQSLSDPSLKKIMRYERIRELYQFVTQIILKKKGKPRRQKKQRKEHGKQVVRKVSSKIFDEALGRQQQQDSFLEWSEYQQRYLCATYLQCSLFKCCEKLKEKFGQSEKWNFNKKIFHKAEELFQKSLKAALKSGYLKQMIEKLSMDRQSLVSQIMRKKTNYIQKLVLKYFKSNVYQKKQKYLNDIKTEIPILLEKPQILKELETKQQYELRIKEEPTLDHQKQPKIKIQQSDNKENKSKETASQVKEELTTHQKIFSENSIVYSISEYSFHDKQIGESSTLNQVRYHSNENEKFLREDSNDSDKEKKYSSSEIENQEQTFAEEKKQAVQEAVLSEQKILLEM